MSYLISDFFTFESKIDNTCAPPNLPTTGNLWRNQDEKIDIEKEPDFSKKKNRKV